MKKLVFTAILLALPVLVEAQIYNAIPQPEEVRVVALSDYQEPELNFQGMVKSQLFQNLFFTLGGNTGNNSVGSWASLRLFGGSFWVSHKSSYTPKDQVFTPNLTTTLLLWDRGDQNYQINFEFQDYVRSPNYLFTFGPRFGPVVFNGGFEYQQREVDVVFNSRLYVVGNNWLEYRYSQNTGTHRVFLFVHFNLK